MPIISVAGHFIYQAITDVGQYYKDSEKSLEADDVTPAGCGVGASVVVLYGVGKDIGFPYCVAVFVT
jgi:hypothetical protein